MANGGSPSLRTAIRSPQWTIRSPPATAIPRPVRQVNAALGYLVRKTEKRTFDPVAARARRRFRGRTIAGTDGEPRRAPRNTPKAVGDLRPRSRSRRGRGLRHMMYCGAYEVGREPIASRSASTRRWSGPTRAAGTSAPTGASTRSRCPLPHARFSADLHFGGQRRPLLPVPRSRSPTARARGNAFGRQPVLSPRPPAGAAARVPVQPRYRCGTGSARARREVPRGALAAQEEVEARGARGDSKRWRNRRGR